MKKYIKPAVELIELRPEEGIACNGSGGNGGGDKGGNSKPKRNCSSGRQKCERPASIFR
ncbi:MAG: hypothetical protein N2484_04145 [Clostridia bacterium]|nr:hypothetical protein [Clostridia bacterium]